MKKTIMFLAVACTAGVAAAQGQVNDGNAVAEWSFNDGIMTGLYPNGIGSFDQVYQYTWMAGVNGLPEGYLNVTSQSYVGNTATFAANRDGLDFVITYTITDGVGNDATVNTTLAVTNNSGAAAVVNVFSYSDLDLNSSSSDDEAVYNPGDNSVTQNDFFGGFEMTHFGFDADRWEIDYYANLLIKLTDGVADTLSSSDLTTPGFDDHTIAFEWSDYAIAGGQTLVFQSALNIPSPGALAVMALGGLGACRRRRR